MIPPIIHQSWKTNEVPENWRSFQNSWRYLHPAYEYHFWTNDDNRALVADRCPAYLGIYDGYAHDIQRADFARYLVLKEFGGVYADLDMEALKPVDALLEGAALVFGLEPQAHAMAQQERSRGLPRIVCNAFMASEKAHPFWDYFFDKLAAAKDEMHVLDSTGPRLLTRALNDYPGARDVTFVPEELLYPVTFREIRTLSDEAIREKARDAFAIHHWAGSWLADFALKSARERIARL